MTNGKLSSRKIVVLIGGLGLLAALLLICLAALFVVKEHRAVMPPREGLVACWPAQDKAGDIAGTNSGILSPDVACVPAEVGLGFQLDDTNAFIIVPASPSLNVGTNGNGLTLEAWIKPNDVTAEHPIFEWNQGFAGGDIGVHLWIGSGGIGELYANIIDTDNNSHPVNSPLNAVVENQFQHVAVTYDCTSGKAVLYVNGAAVMTKNVGSFVPQTSFDLYLGRRPNATPRDSTYGCFFDGIVNAPGIYNRALSAGEIHSIYEAGSHK